MSLPHGCSLQLWVDPRGNMGTARRGEKASRELTAILAGLEGRAKSARGSREGGGGAPDLGAVPWAGERPGRQKGGLGDARHGAPLALKIGRACVRRPQPFLWLERPFVTTGRLTGGSSRDSSQHVRTDTDSVPAPPGRGPNGRPGQAVGSLSAEPLPLQPDASGSRPCAPDSGQLFWFLWGYF